MRVRSNFLLNACCTCLYLGFLLFTIASFVSCRKTPSSNQNLSKKELIREQKEEIEKIVISNEYVALETSHTVMLKPISVLKSSYPKIYWFIVSWLGTNYRTPNWDGYYSKSWQENTKQRGIDCSGFARVMQEEIFSKKIRGGSQGILNQYCISISAKDLALGDLVFFRAPGANSDRIVHVGVYLIDGYFVHATSAKSASKGLGLNVNNLNEKMWSEDFVTGGKIKGQEK